MSKVSVTKFKKFLKASEKQPVTKTYDVGDDQTIDVVITPTLSVEDRAYMIQNIVDSLFIDNKYQPYFYTAAFWYWILKYHTKLPFDELVAKDTKEGVVDGSVLKAVMTIVYNTKLPDDIKEIVGYNNFADIEEEVHEGVEFRKQLAIQQESDFSKVMHTLNDIIDGIAGSVDKFKDFDPSVLKEVLSKMRTMDENKILDFVSNKK